MSGSQMQLHVRTRRDGDRIQPLGMTHEKKIQDILVDKHIPRAQRSQIPLFFSATHCIWLAGIQVDNRVRLTPDTQRIHTFIHRPSLILKKRKICIICMKISKSILISEEQLRAKIADLGATDHP